ncbi:hypothetical protein [Vibrio rotiferianus]|uniref:hypothetical protein n=1 Tax=Vibrio rotiferianus TaxID=190895 RepID=UPI00125F2F55|nr:hypothetical protein [Vibrio rotiferianus]
MKPNLRRRIFLAMLGMSPCLTWANSVPIDVGVEMVREASSSRTCNAMLSLSLPEAELLNISPEVPVFFTLNGIKDHALIGSERLSGHLGELVSGELNVTAVGRVSYPLGISCQLSNISFNDRFLNTSISDPSTRSGTVIREVDLPENLTQFEQALMLIKPLVEARNNPNKVVEYDLDSYGYQLLSQDIISFNQMGLVPEFNGLTKQQIADLLAQNILPVAKQHSYSSSISGELLRQALLTRLGQDSLFEYGSIMNLKATTAHQLNEALGTTNHRILTEASLDNQLTYLEERFALGELSVEPLQHTALLYASLNLERWDIDDKDQLVASLLSYGTLGLESSNQLLFLSDGSAPIGANLYQLSDVMFENLPNFMSDDDIEFNKVKASLTGILLDLIVVDRDYPYGSVDNIKATVAKRMAAQFDSSEFSGNFALGEWSLVFDHFVSAWENRDPLSFVDRVYASVGMSKHLTHKRKADFTVELTYAQWELMGRPDEATFHYRYGDAPRQISTQLYITDEGYWWERGNVKYSVKDSRTFTQGKAFTLDKITFNSELEFSGAIVDSSTRNPEVYGHLSRPEPEFTYVEYKDPRVLAGEMLIALNPNFYHDNPADSFNLLTQAYQRINQSHELIGEASSQEFAPSESSLLLLTREAVARHQLMLYGANDEFIEQYWGKYIGNHTINQMCVSAVNCGGDHAQAVKAAEARWYEENGYNNQGVYSYTITHIWEEQYRKSARLIARALAYQIQLEQISQGRMSVAEALEKHESGLTLDLYTQVNITDPRHRNTNGSVHGLHSDYWVLDIGGQIQDVKLNTSFLQDFNIHGNVKSVDEISSDQNEIAHHIASVAGVCGHDVEYIDIDGRTVEQAYKTVKCANTVYTASSEHYSNVLEEAIYLALADRQDGYRSITTANEILIEVGKAIVPLWGTVESFKEGDVGAGITGLVTDAFSFIPIGSAGVKAATSASKIAKVVKTTSKVASVASKVSRTTYIVGKLKKPIVLISRISASNKATTLVKVTKAISVATLQELNPLSGFSDLAFNALKSTKGKKLAKITQLDISSSRQLASGNTVISSSSKLDPLPLSQDKFDEILGIDKGLRPEPSSYLSEEYIESHLSKFDDGAARFSTESNFQKYGLGQRDGTTFVLTKKEADRLSDLTPEELEQALGLPEDFLQGNKLIRVDIDSPRDWGLRIPSGNEAGANSQWLPGGRLPDGNLEAIIDGGSIPADRLNWRYVGDTSSAPLSQAQIDGIKSISKGQRPNPTEYLSADYIEKHLAEFDEGASRFVTRSNFDKYKIAQRDGTTFVLTKKEADKLSSYTAETLEEALGLPEGFLQDNELLRIDISNPRQYGLRIPSGNEAGANDLWIPGGKLPDGNFEAVLDGVNIPESDLIINSLEF